MVSEHGITDTRQFVGQGAGRLVVVGAPLHLERPVLQAIDLPPRLSGYRGGPEHSTRAVSQQHA